mmetsp:Transcript_32967/g.47741  ORF Transcript_32967/g.47741 Transcript_32967/m.47741 type:complete len:409 (-) Transcript_32967:104-1330(-)
MQRECESVQQESNLSATNDKCLTLLLAGDDGRADQNEQNNTSNSNHDHVNASKVVVLPAEIIPIILSYCCHSLRRIAKLSRVCKSWKEALSRTHIARLHILLGRSSSCKEMMRFAASHLQDVADLSVWSRKYGAKNMSIEFGQFVRSCSSNLKHFSYIEKGLISSTTTDHNSCCHSLDHALVNLMDASNLESLILSNHSWANIDFMQKVLQNKTRLKKLVLDNIGFSEEESLFPGPIQLRSFSVQIGKCHALRELHITSYFDALSLNSLDAQSLLSGLTELQHLHVCHLNPESLFAIHRYCPNLKCLNIADYVRHHSDFSLNAVLGYLQLSTNIEELDVSSSLYGDNSDNGVSTSDVREICRASNTLQRLVITAIASPGETESDFYTAAREESCGRVHLRIERVIYMF